MAAAQKFPSAAKAVRRAGIMCGLKSLRENLPVRGRVPKGRLRVAQDAVLGFRTHYEIRDCGFQTQALKPVHFSLSSFLRSSKGTAFRPSVMPRYECGFSR
jgi:hypothetical protein